MLDLHAGRVLSLANSLHNKLGITSHQPALHCPPREK